MPNIVRLSPYRFVIDGHDVYACTECGPRLMEAGAQAFKVEARRSCYVCPIAKATDRRREVSRADIDNAVKAALQEAS